VHSARPRAAQTRPLTLSVAATNHQTGTNSALHSHQQPEATSFQPSSAASHSPAGHQSLAPAPQSALGGHPSGSHSPPEAEVQQRAQEQPYEQWSSGGLLAAGSAGEPLGEQPERAQLECFFALSTAGSQEAPKTNGGTAELLGMRHNHNSSAVEPQETGLQTAGDQTKASDLNGEQDARVCQPVQPIAVAQQNESETKGEEE